MDMVTLALAKKAVYELAGYGPVVETPVISNMTLEEINATAPTETMRLIDGETYRLTINGHTDKRTAGTFEVDGMRYVYIGDIQALDGGDPQIGYLFVTLFTTDGAPVNYFEPTDITRFCAMFDLPSDISNEELFALQANLTKCTQEINTIDPELFPPIPVFDLTAWGFSGFPSGDSNEMMNITEKQASSLVQGVENGVVILNFLWDGARISARTTGLILDADGMTAANICVQISDGGGRMRKFFFLCGVMGGVGMLIAESATV